MNMDKNGLLEWIDIKIEKLKRQFRKPTHGNCCTCQKCGWPHDECLCEEIDRFIEIRDLIEFNGERKTVSRKWVLSFRVGGFEEDGNISHTPYITTKDVFRLLAELNIEVKP